MWVGHKPVARGGFTALLADRSVLFAAVCHHV